MEVVVSAAILVVVVLGALAALDAVTTTAGANKARTVAATLAEEDQERLRGIRTVSLSGLSETRTVDAGGVPYTIASKAEWVRDATGETVSCTSSEGQVSYLRITSTVTSPATGAAVKPVVLSSIVAPPAGSSGTQGTLAVQVRNAADLPVMNLPVQLTGAASPREPTNEAGCAVFPLLPAGDYAVSLAAGGWVDKAGQGNPVREGVGVTAGDVSTVALAYDRAASVNVEVETLRPGATAPVPDRATSVLIANTGVPPSGFLRASAPSPGTSAFAVGNLFPFPDGYTVFAGSCPGADPSKYVDGYFDAHPGRVAVAPGMPAGTVTVREPAVNIHVRRGGNDFEHGVDWDSPQSGAKVYSTAEGCTETFDVGRLAPGGALPDPGLPFGEYSVCAEEVQDRRHAMVTGIRNEDPAGTPVHELFIETSGPRNGRCP